MKPDHKFDIDRFTELLISAQGNRSQTDFANDSGVSVAYMCKYLNKKFDKPPTPSTIKKIAAHTANGVSLEELLDAAGYEPAKHLVVTPTNPVKQKDFEKLAMATITSSLSRSDYKWTTTSPSQNATYDFSIEITNKSISKWYFKFVHNTAIAASRNVMAVQKRIYMYYTDIIMTCNEPNSKYSFVTNSKAVFEKLIHFHPYMLAMHVSVILIDISTLTVLKEENLKTAIDDDGAQNITCILY